MPTGRSTDMVTLVSTYCARGAYWVWIITRIKILLLRRRRATPMTCVWWRWVWWLGWIGFVLEVHGVVGLVVEESLPFKEILPPLKSWLLLHLLKWILPLSPFTIIRPARRTIILTNTATGIVSIEIFILVFELGHLCLHLVPLPITLFIFIITLIIIAQIALCRVTRWAAIWQCVDICS